MSMTVAVVGGCGFIGTSIMQTLARRGNQVTALDCVSPSTSFAIAADAAQEPAFQYFDLLGSPRQFERFKEFNAVVIAAGALVQSCRERPIDAWKLNVQATLDLINDLAATCSPPRIVFISSGMVYDSDQADPPFAEDFATRATCLYTASKLAVEACLLSAIYATSTEVLILRPFTIYGLQQLSGSRGHLFGRWLEQGERGERLRVFGDGSQVIDPVSAQVVGDACAAYLANPSPEQITTVNVTSGGCLSLLRLAELFVEAGLAPGIELVPDQVADKRRGWGDPVILEHLLGRQITRSPESDVIAFLDSVRAGRAG